MKPYEARFKVGSNVRVADHETLHRFQQEWAFHNKLSADQLHYAGFRAVVEGVGFYHGGDPLYTLHKVPGVWHQACLEPVEVESQ